MRTIFSILLVSVLTFAPLLPVYGGISGVSSAGTTDADVAGNGPQQGALDKPLHLNKTDCPGHAGHKKTLIDEQNHAGDHGDHMGNQGCCIALSQHCSDCFFGLRDSSSSRAAAFEKVALADRGGAVIAHSPSINLPPPRI